VLSLSGKKLKGGTTLALEEREFPMNNANFRIIKELAYRYTGIKLSDGKKEMIY